MLAFGASGAAAQTSPPRPVALGNFWITYYWFAPESWFTAKKILAPGLKVPYREDFLYSARGIAMQGTGTGDDNVLLHWRSGKGAWINNLGQPTLTAASGFTNGAPYARPGGCFWWLKSTPLTAESQGRPTFAPADATADATG